MHYMRWVAILLCIVIMASCFFTWVTIEQKDLVLSGIDTKGTAFGKPGYLHILVCSIAIFLYLLNKPVANKIAVFLTGFNTAWAIRNFILIPACYGGICPVRYPAIYVILLASLMLLMASLMIRTPRRHDLQE